MEKPEKEERNKTIREKKPERLRHPPYKHILWILRDQQSEGILRRCAEKLYQCLQVENDIAERGIALVKKINESVTNQEQKKFRLRIDEHHRKVIKRTKVGATYNEFS